MSRSIATVYQNYQTVCSVHVAKELLLDEGLVILRLFYRLINMDHFLSKRPTLEQMASQPPCKKPKPAAKQGKVLALVRVAEFGADKFFADNGKLCCRS